MPDGESPPATNIPANNVVPITSLRGPGEEARDRLLPMNQEAEQRLLGALLISNPAYERVAEFLHPEHFAIGAHGRIFAAIGKLVEAGTNANPVTLRTIFDGDEALLAVGGAQYLARLAVAAVTVSSAWDYGQLVRDLYLRRELIVFGEDVAGGAFKADLDDPAPGQIERAEQKLFALATQGRLDAGFRPFAASLERAIANAETAFKCSSRTVGVPTGLIDLDRQLGGLHKSDLVILGGRPSMGKTALAVNIAFNASNHDADPARVGFFSLEMSAEQLAARILGEVSGVSGDRIRRGELGNDDFAAFVRIQRQLAGLPLWIDDTPALGVGQLRARARRLKRRQGLDLVVVDYLQLARPGNPGLGNERSRGWDNRTQEVTEITQGLKALAKELEVPVLALSQLSRAVEQREDKRPLLSDLRESGSIEQDADVVMFLYREEYYLREPDPGDLERWTAWRDKLAVAGNKAELIIAKQRHGPTGTVHLRFDHRTTRFDNLA